MEKLRNKAYSLLRQSERFFKTDMIYVAKGGFWLTLNQAVTAILSLGLSIAYANLIDATTYGMYRYVLSFAAIFGIFSLPGLNTAYAQAVARGHEGNLASLLKQKFFYGLIGSILIAIIAFYYFVKGNFILGGLFTITAFFLPTWSLYNISDYFLQGRKLFKQTAIYSTVKIIFTTACLTIVMILTNNVIFLALTYFISWLIIQFLVLKNIKKTYIPNDQTEIGIQTYGKHLTLLSALPTISQYIDRILIFQFLGPIQLAGYNFAIAMPDQLRSYFKNLQNIATPVLASSQNNSIWIKIKHKVILLTFILIVVTVVYWIIAPTLFDMIFPRYREFAVYSQWYSLTILFIAATLPFLALQAKEMTAALYKFQTIKSVFQIGLLFLFLIYWGLAGAIVARVITELLSIVLASVLAKRHLG